MTTPGKLPYLEHMGSISLEEMDSIRLMNRVDTKYITTETVLAELLQDAVECGYRVNMVDDCRVQGYDSIYYDTADLAMYRIHHAGRKVRQKVRIRKYLSTGQSFLEIKHKLNNGRTKKKRIAVDVANMDTRAARDFLSAYSHWSLEELFPAVNISFDRITLVNPEKTERVTIDTAVKFHNLRHGSAADLHDTVIIELKQDGKAGSVIKELLLVHRVFPFRISKYCIGVALTEPNVKRGRFKMKIRYMEKITNSNLI